MLYKALAHRLSRFALLAGWLVAPALAQDAASLPEGPGKSAFLSRCVDCHPIESVTDKRQSEADWRASVSRMSSYGVDLSSEDTEAIVAYLSKNFGLTPVKK